MKSIHDADTEWLFGVFKFICSDQILRRVEDKKTFFCTNNGLTATQTNYMEQKVKS